jgi:dipeptide transport system ATP-binding protein
MNAGPVVEAVDLTQEYDVRQGMFAGRASLKALRGVSFSMNEGKTLAVVGESGCGKSTLARLVTLIERPAGGTLRLDGLDTANKDRAAQSDLRKKVQIVFQDPYGSLNPRKKIGATLEEPLAINTSMSAVERADAARAMMVRVGLRPEHYDRYPHMFSGGQRQRIAIARALMLHPKLVVLDEPVSALDVSIQAQVLNLLVDLQEELNLTYLFISHDLSVVRHFADEVMVMYLGRAVEHGSRDAIFSSPAHPYTRALLSSTPIADPKRRGERIKLSGELPSPIAPPSGCAFHPRCPYAQERCRKEFPQSIDTGDRRIACHAVEERRMDNVQTEDISY